MRHTRNVVVLEDGDFAKITAGKVELSTLDSKCIERDPFLVTWDVQKAEKGGYPHFMLKEIHEQPQTVLDTMRGRITAEDTVTLPEISIPLRTFLSFNRYVIVACGTAYHAGLVGKSFYEHLLRRPVDVQVASEFRD